MMRAPRLWSCLVVAVACLGAACQLRRPETTPGRMLEPELLEPQPAAPQPQMSRAADARPVRLLDTQARGHIGRRVLHHQPEGELTEDPVWRWSSAPDRYLDTALRLEIESRRDLRLVDAGAASTLAVTLLAWHLESAGGTRLVGAIECTVMGSDRVVHEEVIRGNEPVSADLPGNLAAAAGRLLRRLAADSLTAIGQK